MAYQSAKERVARLAATQFGRVSWVQLRRLEIPNSTVQAWVAACYLHRVLPGVYAVGHRAKTTESGLIEAVLYAGPGAMLSHATAAWWVGLTSSRPLMIDVSTPRRCRSIPGIRVHQRRPLARTFHKGLPVTQFPQTMIDYASHASLSSVRRALAQADYDGGLRMQELVAELQSGRPGSRRLREALQSHQPRLADARSGLEVVLVELCEAGNLPIPEINARVYGWDVDALWRQHRLVVEVDGLGNHRTPAQIRRDRRKDLELRAAALQVLRYSDDQVHHQAPVVTDEIRRALIPPALSA
jgi:hypothetical protein